MLHLLTAAFDTFRNSRSILNVRLLRRSGLPLLSPPLLKAVAGPTVCLFAALVTELKAELERREVMGDRASGPVREVSIRSVVPCYGSSRRFNF
jgi:hypothetical protein